MVNLKDYEEYRKFKKNQRLRTVLSFMLIVIFWYFMLSADDFNIDSLLVVGILVFFTFIMTYFVYIAFFKKTYVFEGTVISSKENARTVKEGDELVTQITKTYLVKTTCGGEYWGENIASYNGNQCQDFQLGEEVILFSYGNGNSYILRQ